MTLDSTDARAAINFSIALEHVENDRRLLAELAAMFVQDCPRLLQEARNSIALNDCPGLERAAHTLKGRLDFFGAQRGREQAFDLERMGRTQDLTGAREALDVLDAEMKIILLEIESLTREI
jgi:HPt (histidine-containing phosphotransfer) domain-containing protein